MASRLTFSAEQYFNATDKTAYAGAKMYTYVTGTTTDKTTWTAVGEGTPLANPIVADANGIFPEIYGSGAYTITIKNTDDTVTIYSADNIYPTVGDVGSAQNVVIANVTALKALDVTVYTSADVLGTTTTNDGGQVRYYYDSSSVLTNNDISVVTPDVGGGRWLILPAKRLATGWLPLTSVEGLKVTYNDDEFVTVPVGTCVDSTKSYIMTLGSAFTKKLSNNGVATTFAVGTGLGGLSDDDTLTQKWYGVFLLSKSGDPTDCDIIYATTKAKSLSDAVATAAGFDISRLIGFVLTGASTDFHITKFIDGGNDLYLWDVIQVNLATATLSTGLVVMTTPPFQTAYFNGSIAQTSATATTILFTMEDQTDTTLPGATGVNHLSCDSDGTVTAVNSVNMSLKTNDDSEIRYRASADPAGGNFSMATLGYYFDYSVTDLV